MAQPTDHETTTAEKSAQLMHLLGEAKRLAVAYYHLTGRPLGVTGEIGEYEATRLLNLTLAEARQSGYDAEDADGKKYQIKTRCVREKSNNGQRMGAIKLDHEWDFVLLVVLNEKFEPQAIYQAGRDAIKREIERPGSRARNRGALGIRKFQQIGQQVWPTSENASP
jgi:hypothetical protein